MIEDFDGTSGGSADPNVSSSEAESKDQSDSLLSAVYDVRQSARMATTVLGNEGPSGWPEDQLLQLQLQQQQPEQQREHDQQRWRNSLAFHGADLSFGSRRESMGLGLGVGVGSVNADRSFSDSRRSSMGLGLDINFSDQHQFVSSDIPGPMGLGSAINVQMQLPALHGLNDLTIQQQRLVQLQQQQQQLRRQQIQHHTQSGTARSSDALRVQAEAQAAAAVIFLGASLPGSDDNSPTNNDPLRQFGVNDSQGAGPQPMQNSLGLGAVSARPWAQQLSSLHPSAGGIDLCMNLTSSGDTTSGENASLDNTLPMRSLALQLQLHQQQEQQQSQQEPFPRGGFSSESLSLDNSLPIRSFGLQLQLQQRKEQQQREQEQLGHVQLHQRQEQQQRQLQLPGGDNSSANASLDNTLMMRSLGLQLELHQRQEQQQRQQQEQLGQMRLQQRLEQQQRQQEQLPGGGISNENVSLSNTLPMRSFGLQLELNRTQEQQRRQQEHLWHLQLQQKQEQQLRQQEQWRHLQSSLRDGQARSAQRVQPQQYPQFQQSQQFSLEPQRHLRQQETRRNSFDLSVALESVGYQQEQKTDLRIIERLQQLEAPSSSSMPPRIVGTGGLSKREPDEELSLSLKKTTKLEGTDELDQTACSAPMTAGNSKKDASFPLKLHEILCSPEYQEMIAWLPHGKSWRILKPSAFENVVIPLHFRHSKYASFMRQVSADDDGYLIVPRILAGLLNPGRLTPFWVCFPSGQWLGFPEGLARG
jgi:HSF-type DNA-binding